MGGPKICSKNEFLTVGLVEKGVLEERDKCSVDWNLLAREYPVLSRKGMRLIINFMI